MISNNFSLIIMFDHSINFDKQKLRHFSFHFFSPEILILMNIFVFDKKLNFGQLYKNV